jgi:predicted metal-dependent phosphoesterase TrpH
MIVTMLTNIIDLHTHTIYSDGSEHPRQLINMAHAAGACAVAVTDHDTVGGLQEARTAANDLAMEFINGIEISAEYSPGTMHILGYYIDDTSDLLNATLTELRMARDRRNPQIAARLQSLGFDISYEEVAKLAGNEVVGRPHFARVLVEKGCAESIQEAFNRFLAKGAAAYVEKRRLSPAESIDLIHKAGGAAVLAHPYQLKLAALADVEALLVELASMGLDGVEAIYSRHKPAERQAYAEMAERLGLIVTGGSDFHGTYKPDISIVKGTGDLQVPHSLLDAVRERAAFWASQSISDGA